MPRITAPTVREHRDSQQEAILDAVGDVLAEDGYAGLELATVARKVGLARTSLYRYAHHKDELVAQWLERAFEPAMAQAVEKLTAEGPPAKRIAAWLDGQLDFAAQPRDGAAVRLMAEFDGLPESIRSLVTQSHQQLRDTITDTIAEAIADQPDRDLPTVCALVDGIAGAMTGQAAGGVTPALRTEATRSIEAVLAPTTAPPKPSP